MTASKTSAKHTPGLARSDATTYNDSLRAAMEIDRYANTHHMQSSVTCADHHLVSEQMSLHRRGFVTYVVSGPALGDALNSYTVRDENNMGHGIVYGGRGTGTTKADAIEWARQWHARDPEKREFRVNDRAALATGEGVRK
jgi:hypothetical protein